MSTTRIETLVAEARGRIAEVNNRGVIEGKVTAHKDGTATVRLGDTRIKVDVADGNWTAGVTLPGDKDSVTYRGETSAAFGHLVIHLSEAEKVMRTLRVDPVLWAQAMDKATAEGSPLSEVIRGFLTEYVSEVSTFVYVSENPAA